MIYLKLPLHWIHWNARLRAFYSDIPDSAATNVDYLIDPEYVDIIKENCIAIVCKRLYDPRSMFMNILVQACFDSEDEAALFKLAYL